jgi:hypothetical protein
MMYVVYAHAGAAASSVALMKSWKILFGYLHTADSVCGREREEK